MISRRSAYRGCLLGMAIGDAMGYPVDTKEISQIRADYGPNGILGYDLVNGYAEVSSHTQIAAFTCNGLLSTCASARFKITPAGTNGFESRITTVPTTGTTGLTVKS